jgi:hypothetical protein
MKVKELQEQLRKLDPELDVVCYSEDERLSAEGRGFVLFNLLDVRTTDAERLRLGDGIPYLRFKKTKNSDTIAIIQITSDF